MSVAAAGVCHRGGGHHLDRSGHPAADLSSTAALAADLLRYYWFRLTDVALPLGVALEGVGTGGLIAGMDATDNARHCNGGLRNCLPAVRVGWLALAILVAAFHLGDRAIDRIAPPPPRSHRMADFEAWREACEWVADSGKIPPGARFLTPRLAQTFKWYTGHSDVATGRTCRRTPRAIVQWWDRIQDIYATGRLAVRPKPAAGTSSLAELGRPRGSEATGREVRGRLR